VALMLPAFALVAGLLAPPPETYEDRRVARVLAAEHLTVDPSPVGKRLAFIRVVREDVFAEDEWIPTFFNHFHWLTDEDVVAREVRLRVGDTYDPALAEETARILRGLGILALVRVLPVETGDADTVGLLVYTRDLWSLRLEQQFQVTGGNIDEARLQLTERNLFGRDKQATVSFSLAPLTWTLGESYDDPRLLQGDLSLAQQAGVVFHRTDGEAEGVFGALSVGRPLRDLEQRWSYGVDGYFSQGVSRQSQAGTVLTWDDPATPQVETVRRVWHQRTMTASVTATRQGGDEVKHHLSVGLGFSRTEYDPNAETQLPPALAADFRHDVLPPERTSVYPSAAYAGFEPRWHTYENLSTYGQSEDVPMGPSWSASVAVPLALLGSSQNAVDLGARLAWHTAWAADGLFEASVGGSTRVRDRERLDDTLALAVRGATPSFGLGRLVMRSDYEARRRDESRTLVTLGGDNGLRGYESQQFFGFGADRARFNAEYRTLPLVWSFVHVGAVAFYDGGGVFERLSRATWHQSAGVGLRALLPQFNRTVFRVDAGVPIGEPGFAVVLSAGSSQAVPITPLDDATSP
jgi:hypothetical protein